MNDKQFRNMMIMVVIVLLIFFAATMIGTDMSHAAGGFGPV